MTVDSPLPAPPRSCGATERFSRRAFLSTGASFLALHAARVRGSSLALLQPAGLPSTEQPVQAPPSCLATSRTSYPPLLEKFIAKLNPASDDFRCEKYADAIQQVLDGWSTALRQSSHDGTALRNHLSEGITASSLVPSEVKPLRTEGPLRIEHRKFGGKETEGREKFLDAWSGYL